MMPTTLSENPLVLALGWTLVHSLWQAALLALIVRLLWQFVSQQYAQWRYGLALGAMAVTLVAAAITFGYFFAEYSTVYALPEGMAGPTNPEEPGSEPLLLPTEEVALLPGMGLPAPTSWWKSMEPHLPLLVLFWIFGALVSGLRLAGSWWYMRKLSRQGLVAIPSFWEERFREMAGRMGLRRKVRLHFSHLVEEPITLRHFKPLILFPVGLVNQLSVEQVEAILLHELAHIRRWDYLVNWLQSVLELLFFYHPAVWWLSGQVREAREHCCDDLAVQRGGAKRIIYAQTLTQLTALSFKSKKKLAMSIKGINGIFSKRVKRLFGHYEAAGNWQKPLLSAALGGILLFVFLLVNPDLFANENVITNPTEEEWATLLEEWEVTDTVPDQTTFIKVTEDGILISRREGPIMFSSKSFPDTTGNANSFRSSASSYEFKFTQKWPLFIVDGKVWDRELKELEKLDISGLQVMERIDKKAGAISLYGEPADQNILLLYTQAYQGNMPVVETPETQPAHQPAENPLYVIDGSIRGRSKSIQEEINKMTNIEQVNVWKGPQALAKYGEEGKQGVVEIWTNRSIHKIQLDRPTFTGLKEELFMRGVRKGALYIIDQEQYASPPAWLWELKTENLKSVEVLSTTAAVSRYGEAGKQGAVNIAFKSKPAFSDEASQPGAKIRIRANEGAEKDRPYFVVDGQPWGQDEEKINALDPNNIEKINVLKDQPAVEKYGVEMGRNGVVEITTKKKADPENLIDSAKRFFGIQETLKPEGRPLFIVDGLEIAPDAPYRKQELIPWKNILPGSEEAKTYGEKGKNGIIIFRTDDGNWAGGTPYWPEEIKGYEKLPARSSYEKRPEVESSLERISRYGKTFAAINGVPLDITATKEINVYELWWIQGIPAIGVYDKNGSLILGQPTPPEVVANTFSLQMGSGYSVVSSKYDCENSIYIRAYFTSPFEEIHKNMLKQTLMAKKGITPEKLKAHCGEKSRTPDRDSPLVIVDGITKGHISLSIPEDIDPKDIAGIEVIKDEKALALYGEEGKNGVILITTKRFKAEISNNEPLYVIDNQVISPAANYLEYDREQVSAYEFLAPKEAVARYGEQARLGAILLKTKDGKWKGGKPYWPLSKMYMADGKDVRTETAFANAQYFFIDGQLVSKKVFFGYNLFRLAPGGTISHPFVAAVYGLNGKKARLGALEKKVADIGYAYELGPDIFATAHFKACENKIQIAAIHSHPGSHWQQKEVQSREKALATAPRENITARCPDEAPLAESHTPTVTARPLTNPAAAPSSSAALQQKIEASLQVYPSPFSNELNISFELPERRPTKVSVFTLDGKLVKVLADETLDAGRHNYLWNAAGQNAGVFLVRLEAGGAQVVRQVSKY